MLSAADRALLDQLLALGQTGDHNTGDEDGYDGDEDGHDSGENEDGEENGEDDGKDSDDASVKIFFCAKPTLHSLLEWPCIFSLEFIIYHLLKKSFKCDISPSQTPVIPALPLGSSQMTFL